MIPDELWEILTGEKRRREPGGAPRPPAEPSGPVRPPMPYELEYEPEEPEDEEWGPREPAREPEPVAAPRRRESLEVEPVIVSLEKPLPPAAVRHAAFHERIEGLSRPARVQRRRRRLPLNLGNMDEVRRAVLLREVLGPPKALE